MDTLEDYKFGKPFTDEIPIEEAEKYATVFGEGSPALTKLIKYCIENNIITYASCKGHPEDIKDILFKAQEKGYITFRFDMDYEEDDLAYYLASLPISNKNITAHLESNDVADRTVTIYVPARYNGESEKYFEYILNKLKEYKKNKEDGIKNTYNQDIVQIVDYMFYSWNFYESFEITQSKYLKYERRGITLKKVGKCPSNEQTGILHSIFGHSLLKKKQNNIDEFINSSSKRF